MGWLLVTGWLGWPWPVDGYRVAVLDPVLGAIATGQFGQWMDGLAVDFWVAGLAIGRVC